LKQLIKKISGNDWISYCKAHPDEKGIETPQQKIVELIEINCKAHPDEKGIETAAH